jgi:hypothetical protein
MRHHIEEMEQRIRPKERNDEVDELTAIFQEIGARARAGG